MTFNHDCPSFSDCSPLLKRLRVLESFVNVDSSVVRRLALAVLRQHVAVAFGFVAVAVALRGHCDGLDYSSGN